jgi:hypothetical protein
MPFSVWREVQRRENPFALRNSPPVRQRYFTGKHAELRHFRSRPDVA